MFTKFCSEHLKRSLGRSRNSWKNKINMDLEETGYEDTD
jgi:hypothetical protein